MFYFFSFFYPKALYCTVVLNSSGPAHVPVHPADTLNSCSTSWSSDCHILRERAKTQTELLLGWDICEVHGIYREIVFSLRLLLSYITPPPPCQSSLFCLHEKQEPWTQRKPSYLNGVLSHQRSLQEIKCKVVTETHSYSETPTIWPSQHNSNRCNWFLRCTASLVGFRQETTREGSRKHCCLA